MSEYRLRITLKAARVNAGLTQEDVELQMGISRRTLIRWENGSSFPGGERFLRLCRLYGVLPEDIRRK